MKILSNTTIHEEFINDEARQQLFRPYRPSSVINDEARQQLFRAYRPSSGISDEARQQLFRPYRPSSGLKYKNAECLSVSMKVD
jgi:hypothetical protein